LNHVDDASREREGEVINGLQITIQGSELSDRIAARIRGHEAAISALDARIAQREGDQPFDARAEDGFKTLGELETERQQYRDRVCCLALLRDNVSREDVYALDIKDLRLAELISTPCGELRENSEETVFLREYARGGPIDGLKLTMSGVEMQKRLERRIEEHQRCVERWKREQARTPDQQTDDEPLLPDHLCANEAERHEWRAEVLTFIHDHIDVAEVYRLAEADLAFGELLPAKPGWLEQEEYEERNRVGFQLERLTNGVGAVLPASLR
jgi:hypothetical protein